MNYWEERWAADFERELRRADEVIADINRMHSAASARIRGMVKRIKKRFQLAYGLSEEEAKELLSKPVGRAEYLELLAEIARLGEKNPMRDKLMAKAAAPGYAYRVSVQETMLDELDAMTARLAQEEQERLERHLLEAAKEKAKRAGWRIQTEAGLGFRFDGVSEELARVMIHRPWSGMEFSARIWRNREKLSDLLNTVLLEGLTAGNSAQAMAQEIAEAMDVSKYRAQTLVRTETNYVCGAADLEAYGEAEIEKYRYCATLDMRTSKICRELDGQVFLVKDAVPGKNYPPMHPNCRSVTRADISEEDLERMRRWARDPVTGKDVKVPANMTYGEWIKLQEETYGEERIKAAQKMVDNRAADKKQFKKYQEILGKKQLPDTLEKFQIMKYTEPDEWKKTKRAASTIREVDGKTWSDSFKKKAKDAFWEMRSREIEMSVHALGRYVDRRDKAPDGCDYDKLEEICKKPANYEQDDGKQIHFYSGVALVMNENGLVVSFVVRKNESKGWSVKA